MRPIKLFILFIAICMASMPELADAANLKGCVPNGSIILQRHGGRYPNKRPNAPSRQMIYCTYEGEILTMDFAIPEGICEVDITDLYTGITMCYSIDSSELTAYVYIGTIGEFSIEVLTEKGNAYIGIFTSEEYNVEP